MALPRVVIGGGTGFIGQHLGKLLLKEGYDVINVARMPGAANISWSMLQVDGLPKRTKAVVNLAGQQFMDVTKLWTPGFKQNVQNSRIFTTKALSKAIRESYDKPRAFVLVTGVGAYEPSRINKYDEFSPTTGNDFFSKLCVQWEKAAQITPPVRLIIIRSGAVLGRSGGMINNMIMPFFFGVGGRIGSGKQYLPWIHVNDLVRLIHFAIENEQVKGILNGVSPNIITNEEFTKAFARALNRPAFIPVPEKILNIMFNQERAMILTKGQHVTPKRVIEHGFCYQYADINEACKECAHLFPKKQIANK